MAFQRPGWTHSSAQRDGPTQGWRLLAARYHLLQTFQRPYQERQSPRSCGTLVMAKTFGLPWLLKEKEAPAQGAELKARAREGR